MLNRVLFTLFIILNAFTLRGQDGTAKVELDRDENLAVHLFTNESGLWLATKRKTAVLNGDRKLTKYTPDLKKVEFTVDLKGIDDDVIYDPNNLNYVYFRSFTVSSLMGSAKKQYTQVSAVGKVKTYEYPKDETLDDEMLYFCRQNQLFELWTKKKADNELVIVRYDNQTLKRSKSTVRLPTVDKSAKLMKQWLFSGVTDSLLLITKHSDKKNEDQDFYAVLININTGSIVKNFWYRPVFKKMERVAPSYMSFGSAGMMVLYTIDNNFFNREDNRDRPQDYGSLKLSKDGKSILHYAFGAFGSKTYGFSNVPKIGGIQAARLDLDGKVIWQQETKLTENELGDIPKFVTIPDGRLGLQEFDDQSIGLTYTTASRGRNPTTIGIHYGSDGKRLDFCTKSSKLKGGILKAGKNVVKTIEDLYPCFSTNMARVTKYIGDSKFDAQYTILANKDAHLLVVYPNDEHVAGLVYFKD